MSAAPLDFDDVDDDPLEAIAAEVARPGTEPADEVRERFTAAGTDDALGRLAVLALWWAQVRGDARAVAPTRVVALDAADAAPLPPTVTRRALLTRPAPDGTTHVDTAVDSAVDIAVDIAVTRGAALADELADAGTDLVLLPLELGIPGRALTGYLMGLDPVETNGWQTTVLDDERWMDEVVRIRDVQWMLRGLRGRPIAMVRVLADPRLAAATAFLLRSAARRTPVVLDGPGAATAGLLATRCSRLASGWWLPAELGDAPLHERSLGSLDLTAVTRLGLRVEDGTASAGALSLLGIAATLLARD